MNYYPDGDKRNAAAEADRKAQGDLRELQNERLQHPSDAVSFVGKPWVTDEVEVTTCRTSMYNGTGVVYFRLTIKSTILGKPIEKRLDEFTLTPEQALAFKDAIQFASDSGYLDEYYADREKQRIQDASVDAWAPPKEQNAK